MRDAYRVLQSIGWRIPSFTALAVVDAEPNDQVLEILRGYENLRRASQQLLQELWHMDDDAASEQAKAKPEIAISINHRLSTGRYRDALLQHCTEANLKLIPYVETISEGKNQRLATCLAYCAGSQVLLSDVYIDRAIAKELLVEYRLGALDVGGAMFFWESATDSMPHIVMARTGYLCSDGLLNNDNDRFEIKTRRSFFGGFQCRGWTHSLPTKKYKFSRIESTREKSLQDLMNGFLYEASRKRLSVHYGVIR